MDDFGNCTAPAPIAAETRPARVVTAKSRRSLETWALIACSLTP